MNIAAWKKELETGIEEIDRQHKDFLIMANKFIIRYRAEKGSEAALEELEFLKDYLFYHFHVEETFQAESNYPGYLDHQAEHKHLVFKVKEMGYYLNHSDSSSAVDDFAAFINEWVVGHIYKSDLEFSRYYHDVRG